MEELVEEARWLPKLKGVQKGMGRWKEVKKGEQRLGLRINRRRGF